MRRVQPGVAVVLSGLAVAVGLPAPALARPAAPLVLGDGHTPGITVTGSGYAWISWLGNESLNNSLHFCQLRPPGTACAASTTIPTPADSASTTRPFSVLFGADVWVFQTRYGGDVPGFNAVYRFHSADLGANFDGGTQVGTIPFNDAVVGPGEGVSLITDAYQSGAVYQWVPLRDNTKTLTENVLSTDHPYDGSVVRDGSAALAVFANGQGAAQFRRFTGMGDVNDVANWTAPQDYATDQRYMRLANGVTGVFVASLSGGGLQVRKFNGTTFGSAVKIPGDTRPVAGNAWDFAEGFLGGRLHIAWSRFGNSAGTNNIGYAASRDGVHWGLMYLAGGTDPPFNLRMGLAPDNHTGVVVGDTGDPHRILAIRLPPFGRCGLPYVGTAGDDNLNGDSTGGDRISGLGGDDRLDGAGEQDCLSGGSGDDILIGGDDKDRIAGGPGRDHVSAGGGADRINVRDGEVDMVRCGGGSDHVRADRKDKFLDNCEHVRFK